MTTAPRRFPAGNMRASDADRDRALAELTDHYQAGRISTEEFDDRSGQALQARTGKELADLFADLPEDQPTWVDPSAAAGWSGQGVPAQLDPRPVTRSGSGAVTPVVRTAATAAAVAALIFAALLLGHRDGHPWAGLIVPLLVAMLVLRRLTRSRR